MRKKEKIQELKIKNRKNQFSLDQTKVKKDRNQLLKPQPNNQKKEV